MNVGTTSTPNYQLSLQSRKLGAIDITFSDDALGSSNTAGQRGSKAQYTVNGTTITTDSSTVTLSPGVSLNLLQTSSPTTVSVSRNTGSLETALNNFVAAFNSMNSEIRSQHGQTTSALAGNSILASANSSLRQLMSAASPSNGLNTLYDLGLGFDSNGNLTLDSDQFHKATDGKLDQVKSFLGTTDGTGLLPNLNTIMDSVVKDGSGYLANAIDTTTKSSQAEAQHISDQQDRVDKYETDLRTRMAAADAAIAALQQQVTYLNGMLPRCRPLRRRTVTNVPQRTGSQRAARCAAAPNRGRAVRGIPGRTRHAGGSCRPIRLRSVSGAAAFSGAGTDRDAYATRASCPEC